ncbi:hypothetical protein FOZ63_011508, partial [Perkinsus olseni]
ARHFTRPSSSEDSKVEVDGGGGSGKGGGQSDSLSGDSEVADSGETIKRRETTTTSTTTKTVTSTTTPPPTTPAPSSPSLTFDKHEGEEDAQEESTQAPIPATSLAPTTPVGIDFGESAGVITNSPPEESEGRLTFGMEEGEAQHFVESKSNNAGSSTAAPTTTAPPGPTCTTTSTTTTAAPTTTTEAPVGVHFGEASGAVTTSPPEKTAAPLRFGTEEGEAESVAESRSNVAVSSSTAAPSPTTTVAPSTTTTAGVLFGESDGEVEEPGVPETSGPRVKFGEDDGEVEPEGEGVRLGGGTYVTEGGHRVEEGGHEIRDHRTTNKTESTRFHHPEEEAPDTTFEEDVGNVRPHESTDVATEEEEGEVAEADVDRPSPPLQFSEHAGIVEAEEDKTTGTLNFAGDDGTVVATAPTQQNVQLGGGTTTQHRAGSVEEGGSFLNSTLSQRAESSSHRAGNTAAGGWRVREVKLVDGHRDLTSKSKAQQLANLNIHGGTYTQNHAGHTMEGGFHINDTMRSHRNESVMVGGGEGPFDQPTASGKPSASSVTNSADPGGWRVKALDELPDAARQLAYQRPAADGPSAVLVTPSNRSTPSSMSEENDSGSLPSEGLKAAGMRKLHYALSRI